MTTRTRGAAGRRPTDPRPSLVSLNGVYRLEGARCSACGTPTVELSPRCPICGRDSLKAAFFGPGATVFSATTLHLGVAGRTPPLTFAYVDVDDGPRILVHVDLQVPPPPGSRVRFADLTVDGDPLVTIDLS